MPRGPKGQRLSVPARTSMTHRETFLSRIIAGLAAKGEAIIDHAYHFDRALERIEEKRL